MSNFIDMTNTITKNGVYIIEKASKKGAHEVLWRCQCPICKRKDWIVKGSFLRKKASMCKQCAALKNLNTIKTPFYKDLAGKRFGKLIALEPTQERLKTSVIWKCQCDCGNICYKASSYLINGDTKSCGCLLTSSNGEQIIIKILQDNNIPFEKEKIFKNFSTYRFDFYVNNQYIIEFDGRQHFKKTNTGFGKEQEEIHKRDLIKNQFCFNNNIPIIRIPFDKIDKINYNELNILTSNFILSKENEDEYYRYM